MGSEAKEGTVQTMVWALPLTRCAVVLIFLNQSKYVCLALNASAECVFQSSQFVEVSAWLYHVLTHSTNWCVLQTTCHFTSFTNNSLCCVMSVVYIGGAEGI